jgi:hypothetical protein
MEGADRARPWHDKWYRHNAVSSHFHCELDYKIIIQPTVSRPVCLGIKHRSGVYNQIFITVNRGFLDVGLSLSPPDETTGLPFTITAGPRQHNRSWVLFPWDSWPYFSVSYSRLPQPGGLVPHFYMPQEQGSPVISPGTGFHFRSLLRVSRLRWRYSTPPPRDMRVTLATYDTM